MPEARLLVPWMERIDQARWYTNGGPLLREFESVLAGCLAGGGGSPEIVCLNSGSAALELAIAAMALPAASTVLVPSFTFPATAGAALRNGHSVVFADSAPDTWQLTPGIAREAAGRHHLALVIPVASFGCPVDVEAWDAFVRDTGIPVLIDAAAAFGNQAIGAQASVAFSFHATKPFSCAEGGALVTRDADLASRVRRLANFGFEHAIVHVAGTNAKLSEYAAAIGLAQWSRRPAQLAHRSALWQDFAPALASLPGVRLQQGFAGDALPAVLVVRLTAPAADVARDLAARGIQTRRWYCPPLHRHPAFARFPRGDLTVCEVLGERSLGLPWFAGMTPTQCRAVVDELGRSLARRGDGGDGR